jgi:hypothetical protein
MSGLIQNVTPLPRDNKLFLHSIAYDMFSLIAFMWLRRYTTKGVLLVTVMNIRVSIKRGVHLDYGPV